MRLYNAYYLCKQCKEEIAGLEITNPVERTYRIDNWGQYKEVLVVIRQITCLKEIADDIYSTVPVFVREDEYPQVDINIKNQLISKNNNMLNKIKTIVELYESLGLTENSNGIDVKIPECDSLSTYISYLREIDFIFSQCPLLKCDGGEIKFNTVDVGSQWLTFLIDAVPDAVIGVAATSYILKNLAMLVDKAVQVKSHIGNLEQQREIIRAQKSQNDVLDSSLEIFDTLRNHYLSEAVKAMEADNPENPLENGEEQGKLSKSLEKLCGLLDKGIEIYASIDTQKDIQILFPALDGKAEIPDNIIKYLEDKKMNVKE